MTHNEIHAALVALCDGIVKSYRDDLLVHDRDGIERHDPSVPFLHFSRDSGTYMVHLIAADEYPARGALVPFLFGTADREHILDGVTDLVAACCSTVNGRHTCHYWNGKRFVAVPLNKATQIATEYAYIVRQQWRQGVAPSCPVTAYVALGM